ncbi:hypothetical protein D9M73_90780 [compost metagenome]
MPASRRMSLAIAIRSPKPSIAVQHGADGQACAIAAIAGSCATSKGAACSAGVATITASNGSSETGSRNQVPSIRRRASTRAFASTAKAWAIAFTTAFIPGVPTQASSPALGQGATMPDASHCATVDAKCGSRAVKYCAPWSNETAPTGDAMCRVAIRPPTPRPLSKTLTVCPAAWSRCAQESPAIPAPTMPMLILRVIWGPVELDGDRASDPGASLPQVAGREDQPLGRSTVSIT